MYHITEEHFSEWSVFFSNLFNMFRLLLLVTLLQFAVSKNTTCCVHKQFTAIFSDVRTVTKGQYTYSLMSQDFDRQILGIRGFWFTPGKSSVPTGFRFIQDFKAKRQYVISETGCQVQNVPYPMQGPCLPANAEYLGSSYMGLGSNLLQYNAYRWQIENSNVNITLLLDNENCVPILEGVVGNFNGAFVDTAYTFTTYEYGIKDSSIFNIPPECLQSSSTL